MSVTNGSFFHRVDFGRFAYAACLCFRKRCPLTRIMMIMDFDLPHAEEGIRLAARLVCQRLCYEDEHVNNVTEEDVPVKYIIRFE